MSTIVIFSAGFVGRLSELENLRFSLCMSRSWWSSTSLVFTSNSVSRRDRLAISIGITASMSYVRLKGVSPILYPEVVWYDKSIVGIYFTHAAFDFIKRFLRPLKMVVFDTSVWSLAWGWATEVNFRWICFSSQHSLEGLPLNCLPFSLIKTLGVPNRMRIFFHINFIIFLPMTVANGSTSIHSVK